MSKYNAKSAANLPEGTNIRNITEEDLNERLKPLIKKYNQMFTRMARGGFDPTDNSKLVKELLDDGLTSVDKTYGEKKTMYKRLRTLELEGRKSLTIPGAKRVFRDRVQAQYEYRVDGLVVDYKTYINSKGKKREKILTKGFVSKADIDRLFRGMQSDDPLTRDESRKLYKEFWDKFNKLKETSEFSNLLRNKSYTTINAILIGSLDNPNFKALSIKQLIDLIKKKQEEEEEKNMEYATMYDIEF